MDILIRARIAISTAVGVVAAALAGCVPDVDVDESFLGAPRVVAIAAEPPEAVPGQTVRFRALVAGAEGEVVDPELDWSFCVARKPLAELGPVAPECLAERSAALVPLGVGPEAEAALPADGCRLFGPEPPPLAPGEPPGRRVDPDVTGGYYQPLRVLRSTGEDDPTVTLFETRLACGLFGANQAQAAEYRRRYRRNAAPRLDAVELVVGGVGTPVDPDVPVEVDPGATVTLRARWPTCPAEDACGDAVCGIDETATDCALDCTAPMGCGGAERYLRLDLAARQLVDARESLRVAWLTTAGTFPVERTGVAADDVATTASDNDLVVPQDPGDLTVFVVLRDDRGGVSWRTARLRIRG